MCSSSGSLTKLQQPMLLASSSQGLDFFDTAVTVESGAVTRSSTMMLHASSCAEQEESSKESFFVGRFSRIRARLDYSYHSVYSAERQLLQDDIILAFLSKGRPSTEEPWAIFTAGAMGVGKTWCMSQLQRKGLLSLDDFVYVDPDALRECIPEHACYLQEDAETAGFLTQKEAGVMAEILTHAALDCGMSIIVDGSLRDSSWYEKHYTELRQHFPKLCLSIFLISAPLEDIYQRVTVRCWNTISCLCCRRVEVCVLGHSLSTFLYLSPTRRNVPEKLVVTFHPVYWKTRFVVFLLPSPSYANTWMFSLKLTMGAKPESKLYESRLKRTRTFKSSLPSFPSRTSTTQTRSRPFRAQLYHYMMSTCISFLYIFIVGCLLLSQQRAILLLLFGKYTILQ